MQDFLILNRQRVEDYNLGKSHVLISVRDPGTLKAKPSGDLSRLDSLFLEFSDMDISTSEAKKLGYKGKLFSKDQAREILDFFIKYVYEVDGFVINCEAGISRSAGIGAALAKICGYDDELFFKKFIPNRKVYRTLLEVWYTGYGTK